MFLALLAIVTCPAAVATACLVKALPLSGLILWALIPFFALAFLLAMIAMALLVRLALPRLEPGTHAFPGSRAAKAWLAHLALARIVALPLWSNLVMAFASLRFLALRARGARVAFDIEASLDVYLGDAPLLEVGSGVWTA
jgi:hypothetical protein